MQHHGKKLCSLLLALCMIISLVPVSASAALLAGEDYITQQLLVGEDIVLHLLGNVPAEYRDGSSAELTYAGKTDTYTINDLTPSAEGLYDLPVELLPVQMTEQINLVLTAKMGLIDVEAINETYTVRDYLKTLIEDNYTRETKLLSQELLNYGAWAQKYFGYNTDDLANKGYDIQVQNPVPSEMPAVKLTGKVDGIKYYGATVLFQSKTGVRYYFYAPNGVNGYTATVDGKAYTLTQKGSLYYVEVPDINAKDMATEMTVAVTDGTNTLSVGYTPTDYFARCYHKATDETTKGLMEAAYSYFTAAKSFTGVSNTGSLSFTYAGGTANSIQVNTNLPADTAVADFTLTENGCSVNEDANSKKASNVGMANVDGTIVLTFNFAENFSAGETYSLPRNAFFAFTDNSQYALAEDYIFQFNGTDWTQVQVAGDFTEGVDFEELGNTLLFTGEGPASKAATITRVSHNTEIPALSNGGDYALKLSHASSYYPTFRINFGKELAAGTQISFMAFGLIYGDSTYNQGVFEFNDGGDATAQFNCEGWTQLTMTLSEAADHVDLFWNFERAGLTDAATTGAVYVDNFIAIEPVEPEGDILKGWSFETAGNAGYFVGQGKTEDATIVRTAYANTDVAAPANGGEYALKLSHPNNYWPTFRINFGKELAAGTKITFMAYGKIYGESTMNKSCFEYSGTDTGEFACGVWTPLTITLTEAAEYLDLFWNYDRAGITSTTASGEVYIDNMLAVEPAEATGDFLEGVDFETAGNEGLFTGLGIEGRDATIEKVPYTFAGITAPENGGEYALKVSHASDCWPNFRVNFGKTLKAGTTITFDVYGNYDYEAAEGVNKYFKLELTEDSKNFATSANSSQIVWTLVETWNTGITITLTADSDHVDLFYNVADGSHGNVPSWILLDNFKAVEPVYITDGLTFDNSRDAEPFTGVGGDNAWRDAAMEIVSFDGDNALKLTCASSQWPTFRINFGKTLPAGTTITFQAYTDDTSGIRATVSVFEAIANWTGTTTEYYHGSWNEQTITLTADCSYVDIMCNMDRWNEPGPANMAVYLDDFQVDLPFSCGVDFENAADINYFGGVGGDNAWRDATMEIVSFDGDNALKLTCASSQWPTFRINFGETLAAGTTITFRAYTDDTSGIRTTVSVFEAIANWTGTTIEYYHGSWNEQTITLTADCSYVDIMCNMDRWNEPGPANMIVYIDDITVNAA